MRLKEQVGHGQGQARFILKSPTSWIHDAEKARRRYERARALVLRMTAGARTDTSTRVQPRGCEQRNLHSSSLVPLHDAPHRQTNCVTGK